MIGLGCGSVLLAAGLAAWLTAIASADAAWPAGGLGAVATAGLVVTLAVGRPEPIAGSLVLLGSAYAVILVVDEPPLDARAAIVGAALLTIGELAYLAVGARTSVTEEGGAVAGRLAVVALVALLALVTGGALVAVVDLVRTGGFAVELIGAAAAAGAVGLLVMAAREARRDIKNGRAP